MTRRGFWTGAVAILLSGAALTGTLAFTGSAQRTCCEKRSSVDPNRPDCPGQIKCPLTGELVCRDRCPAEGRGGTSVPSCCTNKN